MGKPLGQILGRHKVAIGLVTLALGGAAYWYWTSRGGNGGQPRYVLASVERGTLTASVAGSGQVAVSNQVEVKAKASGDVVAVNVQNGQAVPAGTVLVQLDARDALKAVRDAQANLDAAKLTLAKLKQPVDALALLQAENALTQARDNLTKLKLTQQTNYQQALEAKQKATDTITKGHEDGFNLVANAFLNLPDVMAGFHDILYGTNFGSSQTNLYYYSDAVATFDERINRYRDDAETAYQKARKAYDQNFIAYKATSRFSDAQTIETIINQTYDTSKLIADAVKSATDFIQFYQDRLTERNRRPHAVSDTHLASLATYTSQTNSHLASLLGIKRTIQDNREALANAERKLQEMDQNNPLERSAAQQALSEREASLAKLRAGPDPLDIQSQELAIRQRDNAWRDAREKLADYSVRAPFDGIVAAVAVKPGDPVSASAVATLITAQRIAEISLNEVDVARVKVGQKTTLTFDAVPDLSLSGAVAEIDTLGTTSQGVVSYTVKISFDTQDDRVKPGMTVTARIITEAKLDVLYVPGSAVKAQGNTHYVEAVDGNPPTAGGNAGVLLAVPPRRQPVEVGIANDESTEITSGLQAGDVVVVSAINAQSYSSQWYQQNSAFRIPGLPGGGGGGGMRGGFR